MIQRVGPGQAGQAVPGVSPGMTAPGPPGGAPPAPGVFTPGMTSDSGVGPAGGQFSNLALPPGLSDVDFVRQMYRTYLGREPEPSGLAHHLKLLAEGMTREQMEAGISGGQEAQQRRARQTSVNTAVTEPVPTPPEASRPVRTGEQRVEDGPGGFLWKPRSDSDGKLAVLLPPAYTGLARRMILQGPDGTTLAEGRDGGVGNGDRQHYRFPRPGDAYPAGTRVVVELADGQEVSWTIRRPASRVD